MSLEHRAKQETAACSLSSVLQLPIWSKCIRMFSSTVHSRYLQPGATNVLPAPLYHDSDTVSSTEGALASATSRLISIVSPCTSAVRASERPVKERMDLLARLWSCAATWWQLNDALSCAFTCVAARVPTVARRSPVGLRRPARFRCYHDVKLGMMLSDTLRGETMQSDNV